MRCPAAPVLLATLALAGCAGAARPARAAPPAPVLDTPSDVPALLVVDTPAPPMTLVVDLQTVRLLRSGAWRTLQVDRNAGIFAGRHVMAHDAAGTLDLLVAGKLCQSPSSGEWVPYSARVTLDGGGFVFGCARALP